MQITAVFLFLLSISAAAAEDACPPTEVVKFAELYANPHLHPCQKVSAGFSLVPPMGYPTEQQVKTMCAAEACRALVKDVLALEPADCYLSFSGVKLNAHKMACIFREACEDGTDHKEHEDSKHKPTPKPTDDKHHLKPTKHDDKHYPTPKPTEDKHYKTPMSTEDKYDDKHHPTPKPTDDKYHPKLNEDKHYPTWEPSEGKYSTDKTPKPTEENYDDKHHPTPKPTKDEKYYDKLEEPKIVKVDHVGNVSLTTQSIGKEADKSAHKFKPPMNGTAQEFFPMPNTTYKATPEPKAT